MQAMIFEWVMIYMKQLPKRNVRFFKIYSCSQGKKNSNVEKQNQSIEKKSNDFNKQDISKDFLEKKKTSNILYLLNKEGAKQYASIIIEELLKNNVPVLEMQPGLGFLTRELLDAGIPEIYLYEQDEKFIKTLIEISKQYPGKIHLRNYNLMQLFKVAFIDFMKNEATLEKVFSGIKLKNDFNKPSFQIVGPMPHIKLPMFLTSLDPKIFLKFENVILYVAALPSVFKAFNDIPGNSFHKPKNIYLRVRFKYKILDEIPRKYFYPLPKCSLEKEKKKISSCQKDDSETVYIMKLELNHNHVNQKFTNADWYHFLHFLRMSMNTRHSRVIPTLEKWIPSCGPRLIQHNFHIYSKFSDLTSSELLNLFQIFQALPGYESSSFISILHAGIPNFSEIYSQDQITHE